MEKRFGAFLAVLLFAAAAAVPAAAASVGGTAPAVTTPAFGTMFSLRSAASAQVPAAAEPASTEARHGLRQIDTGDWEAGIILGEPTGFSAKFWTTWNTAIDFGLAWSFGDKGHVHIHGDYLFHNFNFFDIDEGDLPVYFGIGGRVRLEEDDSRVGLRFSFGMEYIPENVPLAFFFELAPIVDFAPETEGNFNGGLGVRYVF